LHKAASPVSKFRDRRESQKIGKTLCRELMKEGDDQGEREPSSPKAKLKEQSQVCPDIEKKKKKKE